MSVRDGVDQGVKVECREVRVLCLDEYNGGGVVPGEVDVEGEGVVEVGERNTVLGTQRLTNNDLIDVIKLVPVLVPAIIKLILIINKSIQAVKFGVLKKKVVCERQV